MKRRFGLRDDQWERIEGLLPGRESSVGVTAADSRLFVEAVLYRYRTGIPWRDLPERFGDGVQVHRRFSRWAKSGVCGCFNISQQTPTTNMRRSTVLLCAPISKAPAPKKPGEDQAIGRSRGGLSTKIHTLVNALGNPLGFFLTGGEAHDLVGADHLLPTIAADMLIADKAFDADERVLAPLAAAGKTAVIPPRANRSSLRDYNRPLYGARHLIENFLSPTQLIGEVREPIPTAPCQSERYDCEYRRNGTANLFVFIDAHKSWRHVKVTDHRTARDVADCVRDLADIHYPEADRIRVVLDNLSTHTAGALYEAFPAPEAHRVL